MSRQLHIVCLDAPWPADYGGAIDMMNRIKAFKKKGIKIHLHYFDYKERGCCRELHAFCETVQTYPRKKYTDCASLHTPYIVASRINEALISNINSDNHPVLLEGLHCTGILPHINRNERKICVRMHNEESIYYKELARCTGSIVKKVYYNVESRLAAQYTPTLPKDCMYACVSEKDAAYFSTLGMAQSRYIPTFPAWQKVNSPEGMGHLCLYHANLSVPENEKAALWLLCNVFTKARVPFIIAGKNPSKRLQKAAALCQHTCLVSNPGEQELNDLVQKAHINVLPLFNKNITGIRLKLLHALFEGRHCVVTPAMVEGTGLEGACHIGTNANAIASIVSQLYYQPFTEDEITLRRNLLEPTFDNNRNIEQFINYLW